ncbi:MAG: saccharopine dehydrogenase [Moraxellaceae bacterium]|nr:MAG: saccharopine dehydrogenase [Moraxellaceae bacterium]
MSARQYDVIVFGATSFAGQILCQYLKDNFNIEGKETLRWAMAGRSKNKLEQVKQTVGLSDITIFIADAEDANALRDLCTQTKVIVSTVGPYALYGEPLVKACVENGTDYCDLAGEVHWVKAMLDKYEDKAKQSGARIVNCCGFDSIPSDLGVYYTQQQAQQKFGSYCQNIKMRVKAAKGGASGGTIASIINIAKEAAKDPSLRKQLSNPYLLCPNDDSSRTRQFNTNTPTWDTDFSAWTAPFIMAVINTRIVFRSNLLANTPYGKDFTYDEAVMMAKNWKGYLSAATSVAGISGFFLGVLFPPSRFLLERYVLPKPGSGPTPEEQVSGYYDLRFFGTTPSGESILTKVTGQGDPGYGSTSKLLGQAAACLALDLHQDQDKIEKKGGFWTPATVLGDLLISRLVAHADIKFEVLSKENI